MADKFLIAPFTSGLVKDLPIWQTPEDSFEKLNNAYVHRGVIRKRFGSKYIGTGEGTEFLRQLKTRLRILIGVTDPVTGNIDTAAAALPVGSIFKAGQMFSVGDEIFTVPGVGTPITMLRSSALVGVCTFDTTSGAYAIVNAEKNVNLYWYPTEPVMGLTQFEAGSINNHTSIAFDTRFAYRYTGGGWSRIGTQVYKGDNLNYFWASNFEGPTPAETALFVTNYNANAANSDPIYYTLNETTWTAFKPKIRTDGGLGENIVITAKIIAPFKSRLCLFSTYEYENKTGAYSYKSFKNRMRFSAIGNPLTIATGWLEAKQTGYMGGGYTDAPTEEEIMSVQYVRDELIVFFERSTYKIVHTRNSIDQFVWQKLSTDLGSESPFSSIPSEGGAFTIGTTGIHQCNGLAIKRIDANIPDEISTFLNVSDAVKRIHGIKDYDRELFYWTLPAQKENDPDYFPDKILSFNYENNSWALFDDCFTCFGYFEQELSDTWEEDYQSWEDDIMPWNSGIILPNHRNIIAGNQHGFVVAIDATSNSNAAALQISKVTGTTLTINQNNLEEGSYVLIHNSGVTAQDIICKIDSETDDTITISGLAIPAYKGGATVSRVSRISIKSTAWNPYSKQGNNVYLSKVTFCVAKAIDGEININYIPSGSNVNAIKSNIGTGANLGTYNLEMAPYDLVPLEASQAYLWHAVYLQAEGNYVQIKIRWSDVQMLNKSVVQSKFEIQGLILETSPSSSMG